VAVSAPLDGYKETPARVTTTALVSYDGNRYSVNASAVRYRLGLARFPMDKDLDRFEFSASPVNEAEVRSLAGNSCST
jgi:hypothetical protein